MVVASGLAGDCHWAERSSAGKAMHTRTWGTLPSAKGAGCTVQIAAAASSRSCYPLPAQGFGFSLSKCHKMKILRILLGMFSFFTKYYLHGALQHMS